MTPIKLKPGKFKKSITYYLPSGYEDLTLEKYLGYANHIQTPEHLVSYLMGAPLNIDASNITPYLYWLGEPLDLEQFTPAKNLIDIKRQTYGQKIEAHNILKEDTTLRSAAELIQVYYPLMNPKRMKLGVVLPIYLGLVEQLREILTVEKSTLETPPNPEQMRAGISEFEKLGYFNSIDDLAGGDPLKYDTVLQVEYIVIYQKLLRNKISANFGERYSAILREKK